MLRLKCRMKRNDQVLHILHDHIEKWSVVQMLLKNMSKHSQHDRHLVASNKLIVSKIATNVLDVNTHTHTHTQGIRKRRTKERELVKRKKWLIVSHLFGDYTTRTTSLLWAESNTYAPAQKRWANTKSVHFVAVQPLCRSRSLFFLFLFFSFGLFCDVSVCFFFSLCSFDWLKRRDHID